MTGVFATIRSDVYDRRTIYAPSQDEVLGSFVESYFLPTPMTSSSPECEQGEYYIPRTESI